MAASARAGLLQRPLVLLAVLAAAGLLAGVLLLGLRARARRHGDEQLEPSFETSILAFPPEPRFERRTLPRT